MIENKRPKTFLFFPIEIGLAHICRPLVIAEELVRRGHTVYFALSKRKWQQFPYSTVTLVPITGYVDHDDFGMNVKSFRNSHSIDDLVREELHLIDRYKPDVAVVDFRISALVATVLRSIRTYAIFVGDALPYGALLPNPGIHTALYRIIRDLIPRLYDLASRWYIRPYLHYLHTRGLSIDFDEWMHSVEYLVPEHPSYMPAASSTLKVHHIGTLGWYGFTSYLPEWFDSITPDGKTIYLSFGGTGFDKQKPVAIARALIEAGYRVVVSTGTVGDPTLFPNHPRLFVTQFLPGDVVSSKVDIVVCHGGYGTTMDAIQHGKPVVAVPFNPDQIIHAARFQELGFGVSLWKFRLGQLRNILTFDWKYIEDEGKKLPPTRVVEAVDRIRSNYHHYAKNIQKFNHMYQSTRGPQEAADIIEHDTPR